MMFYPLNESEFVNLALVQRVVYDPERKRTSLYFDGAEHNALRLSGDHTAAICGTAQPKAKK